MYSKKAFSKNKRKKNNNKY